MTRAYAGKTDEEIVVAYWHDYVTRHVSGDAAEADRWFWAYSAVEDLVHDDRAAALSLVVGLAEACASAQALAYLGAGPVEDLVKAADEPLLERVLEAARRSARFRRALATIWLFDDDEARSARLKRFFEEFPPTLPDGVADDAVGP